MSLSSNPDPAPTSAKPARGRKLGQALIWGLAASAIAAPLVLRWPNGETLQGWLHWFIGPWGPLVFTLTYIVATVLLIPASALTIAAGGIYGLAMGTILVSLGSNIGAAIAFLIARYFARGPVA